ncbi:accessory Sec system protein Asp1 [Lactobacillus salivarius]|uniref:Accessory Sec system protein Asp1 n=2 Tax=Ligilactobacillus salivarius TaxID=1624 RepID=A0A7X2MDG4_9LACO|nr:accessory Sec system protein Asp1 [Ligilactobacillus salivarius]
MFYFIPTWNQSENDWSMSYPEWYFTTNRMEFDDTVNQLMMFKQSKQDMGAIILEYAPMLRDFLQRQDLYEIEYYSIFDDLQDTYLDNTRPVDPMEFAWPKNAVFIYNPFYILVKVNNQPYAQIISGNLGQLQRINFLKENKISKAYIFDDRGFLSSIITYTENGFEKQEFFNLAGEWRFRLENNGEVLINPLFKQDFKQGKYASMKDLISEKYYEFIQSNLSENDVVVLAGEKRHNQRILDLPKSGKIIMSVFSNRLDIEHDFPSLERLSKVDVIVVDTPRNMELVQAKLAELDMQIPVLQIPPFDSRLRLGQSQRIRSLKLFLLVDKTSLEELKIVVNEIIQFMRTDKRVELILGGYAANSSSMEKLDYLKERILDKLNITETDVQMAEMAENQLQDEESQEILHNIKLFKRVEFYKIDSENVLVSKLNFVRLIIDMGEDPDLYLQIAGISAGIPQINSVASPYVEHQKNGLIVADSLELKQALEYYLVGLKNWNQALVYAAGKIVQYSSDNLVEYCTIFPAAYTKA